MLDWKMGTVSTAAAIRRSSAAFFIFSPRIRIGPRAREKIDGYKEIEAKANNLLGNGSKSPVRPIRRICGTGERYRFRRTVIGKPDLRRRTGNGIGTLAEHTDGVSSRSPVFLDTGDLPKLMSDSKSDVTPEGYSVRPEEIHSHLRHLDRRQWWLWSTTVAVILLLTLAVASFAFPAMLSREQGTYSFYLNQSVRALVGMVLVFSVYVIYQQVLIYRMRNQISEQIQSLAKVESLASEVYKLAALDQLTGLYNRRSGEQRLAQEISRAQRHGRPLTVLLLDLNELKAVNDKLGHAAGDLVIKGFAERLQRAIRGSDLAVRLGGDEFMALLPECRADEVRHVLARVEGLDVDYQGEKIRCNFSSGWTDYKAGESPAELLKRADDALYSNKRSGKQKVNPSGVPSAVPQAVS
jgi:diguanylate cyclase (GGDEF)-like protein